MPFSFWLPGQANVVIPSGLVEKAEDFKMAIAHELQHHRQQDTKWVYVLWILKFICLFNPAIYLWNKWISEIQEFACDETLIDRKKVKSQEYARCLVEVAQSAIRQKSIPMCAIGMSFLFESHTLKRRIENMLVSKKIYTKGSVSLVVSVVISLLMSFAAFASKEFIHDRRITMSQAQGLAARFQKSENFRIVINELVLAELNRYIGTKEGREFMRNSLRRMENYRLLVEKYLHKYDMPDEFLAMPIIESGYQNLLESQNVEYPSWKAAGLWQFIPSTARNFGLQVDEKIDERLNVELLTDAAMRYLKSNYARFNDWSLSAFAYNMGESNLQKAIEQTGSRDAWTLIRNGYEGDKNYLAKFMAAIIIMKNPQTIE